MNNQENDPIQGSFIQSSTDINSEVHGHSTNTLRTLSLGGLVNALSLSMLNNTANQYSAQNLSNSAMVATCEKILKS